MKAVIYARVSTRGQEDNASLESQIAACRQFAEQKGFRVVNEVKEVYSGAYLFDRPQLNELREKIRSEFYDALIIDCVDRLTRDVAHLYVLKDECRRYNTELHFANKDYEDSLNGKILMSLDGIFAEAERLKITERTTRGRKTKAISGTLSHKRKLYGYDLDSEGRRVINEYEAEQVRFIFHHLALGNSLRAVAEELNRRGVPTPKNGVWWCASVKQLVDNTAYYGRTVVNRQLHIYKYKEGKRYQTHTIKDESEWIELPSATTPPIITQEEFNLAHKAINHNKTEKRKPPVRDFLLRGRLHCQCGRLMSTATSGTWRNYVCASVQNPAVYCRTKRLKAEKVETTVWELICSFMRNPDKVDEYISEAKKGEADKRNQLEADVIACTRTEQNLEQEINTLVENAGKVSGRVFDRLLGQINKKETELDEVQHLREQARIRLQSFDSYSFDKSYLKEIARGISDKLNSMEFSDKVQLVKLLQVDGVWDGKRCDVKIALQNHNCNNVMSVPIETITDASLTEQGFYWREKDGIKVLVSRNLEEKGFVNGFSTRLGGVSPFPENDLNLAGFDEDSHENIFENRRRFLEVFGNGFRLSTVWQIHSDLVKLVQNQADAENTEERFDALTSNLEDLLIGVKTADCVPVLVGDTRTGAYSAIHAGWRGTIESIVIKSIEKMRENFGTKTEDIVCAIGPAASGKNYEIGQDVIDAFAKKFPNSAHLFQKTREGHAKIDLHLANKEQLLSIGVFRENIDVAPYCTMERTDLFFSYRVEKRKFGKTGRLLSVIGRKS